LHFLQSPYLVDMKKVVECQKEFFAYFNALETRGVMYLVLADRNM
jgi:hypothetical protein